MNLDRARMKRLVMSVRNNLRLGWRYYLPRMREGGGRLARASGRAFLTCKKYTPNLRQVSGLVMIVNTFLPALVVLILGLMIWSTVSAIKHGACVTADYMIQAFADGKGQKNYVAAPDVHPMEERLTSDEARLLDRFVANQLGNGVGRPLDTADERQLADIMKTMNARSRSDLLKKASTKQRVLKAYLAQLMKDPPANGTPCEEWKNVSANIKLAVVDELYGKTVAQVTKDIEAVGKDLNKVKTALAKAIPTVDLIKYSGIGIVDKAIWAANQVIKLIRDALDVIGGGFTAVGSYLASPLVKAQANLAQDFQKVDYKRAAAWALIASFFADTASLFAKFKWFFVVLVLWLVLSYVLWMYRRLAVGWALLRNREAIRS